MMSFVLLAAAQVVLAAATSTTTTSSTAAAAVPSCAYNGWDKSAGNIGYYADDSSTGTTYSAYATCSQLCSATTDCASFAYDAGIACILYSQTAEANVLLDAASPWAFFNRGGVCPSASSANSTVVSATTNSSSSTAAAATATCTGFEGYDAGGANIGYYPSDGTYAACYAVCEANPACLSFGITSNPAACVIYNYTVEGNAVSSAGSSNFFYNRGGVCPNTTTPVQTGAFPGCPSNLVPFDVNTYATPYSSCNASYPVSACMADNDGVNNYCNLCLACTTQVCTADADCDSGFACIKNSDCPVDGYTTGTAVCMYMGGGEAAANGCYGSTRSA